MMPRTGIVGRDADGDAVTRHDLDAEAAHPAAQLGEHFVAGVALHAVEATAVHGHHRALHVNQIVFAHSGLLSAFSYQPETRPPAGCWGLELRAPTLCHAPGAACKRRTASSTCLASAA